MQRKGSSKTYRGDKELVSERRRLLWMVGDAPCDFGGRQKKGEVKDEGRQPAVKSRTTSLASAYNPKSTAKRVRYDWYHPLDDGMG